MSLADENEWLRAVWYGEWGSGKTTAVAHAAKLGPVKHVDSEFRLKGGALRRLGIPTDNIDPFRDIDFHNLRGLVENVREDIYDADDSDPNDRDPEFEEVPTRWQAFVHDSVTEIGNSLLRDILATNVKESQRRAEKRGEEVTINPFQIDVDYWGEMVEQYRRLFRDMRNLPCHLLFTAQLRRDVDKNDASVRYGPATTPALQAGLMGYVDVCIYTYRQGKYFLGLTEPGTKYMAKDAFGVLPPVMVQPTADRVVAYMREELTINTDPVQQAWLAEQAEAAARLEVDTGDAPAPTEGRRRRSRSGT